MSDETPLGQDAAGECERVAELASQEFEFSYADERALDKGVLWTLVIYAALGLLFLLLMWGTSPLLGLAVGGLYFAMGVGAVLGWRAYWLRVRPERVVAEGAELRICRQCAVGTCEQTFPILQIHDLHAERAPVGRYRLVWPLPKSRRPPVWDSPEPIVFTFGGRAYSFGAAPMSEADSQIVVNRLVEYDGRLRDRLGMPPTPSIATLDHDRYARCSAAGWDLDVRPL